jgi:NAD(P)-dependent dehydrogenase (short-subunit alcohol dehydrogenase family)
MTVWFITGASRGFGIEITRQALGRGNQVAATARNLEAITQAIPDAGDALLALPLDVTSADQAAAAVSATIARFGRIDALVNNAGRGLLGAVEEVSDAEARAVFDVDVFGLLTVTHAVLPVMREQGAGTIINISSSGGFIGRSGWGVYCAAKFAVEGLSESIRHELAPLGIRVTAWAAPSAATRSSWRRRTDSPCSPTPLPPTTSSSGPSAPTWSRTGALTPPRFAASYPTERQGSSIPPRLMPWPCLPSLTTEDS